ncbi:MAG: branched-chain amino acid ABC transporter substrate-binding protein [Chloroflexota bacterium]
MIDARIVLWIRRFALLLSQMILIVTFGCGPRPTPIIITLATATESPSSLTQAPPTAQIAETQAPALTPTPFVPRAVIKIFSHGPLSGEQAVFGKDMLRGAELAVLQLSGPLHEFSYQVELVPYDDQNIAQTARVNAQEIVGDPEILCGVGHYDSDITIATSDLYHLAGLALVAPSATGALLTDRNYLEVNRVIGRTDGQGTAAAQFAKAQGYGSVYIISQQIEGSLRNAEYFRRDSGSLGIQLLGMVVTELTAENKNQIISGIMNTMPDVVYISSAANQAIPFLTELRAAGYAGAILGTEALNDQSMVSLAGPSLVEGGGMYYTITSAPAQYYSNAAKFVQDFNTQYGTAPLSFAARAYDATGVCLKAIEEASKANGGIPPTRGEVATALRRLNNYDGITGTYGFNGQGDPDPVQYYMYQVVSVDAANWDQNPIIASYDVTPP